MRFVISSFIALALSGCSTVQPIVAKNDAYQKAGEEKVKAELASCLKRAEREARRVSSPSVAGVVPGSTEGGISGGGRRGNVYGSGPQFTGKAIIRDYVEKCMEHKGFIVEEWK